jgi:hypothetical protein
MTTVQYENELPRHYFLRVEGYNNKVLEERRFARMQTFFSLLPHVDKKFTWAQFIKSFPLPGDEVQQESAAKIMTPEMLKQIQEAHNKHTLQVRKGTNKR